MPVSFEDYLAECLNRAVPVIDHSLRTERPDGRIKFYIHPANADGDTPDFVVSGNVLCDYVTTDPRTHLYTDTDRLEALLSHPWAIGTCDLRFHPKKYCVIQKTKKYCVIQKMWINSDDYQEKAIAYGDTPRAAIDAALEESAGSAGCLCEK